jgi:hypothetical protein
MEGIQVIRELHPAVDEAVVAAVRRFANEHKPWEPARDVTGNPTCTTFNIPLRIGLQ